MKRIAKKGQIAVELLFLSAVVVALIAGFVSLAASLLQISVRSQNKLQAFAIAEAGIEYYRWHLAHAPQDFTDGTGHAGPYVHEYYDKDGNEIGQFSLAITPPQSGSTIVTITSTGSVLADASVKKVIQVRMGIPSFAKYATAANADMRFGAGTEVYGEIVSNGGIRFDGVAHNLISSALTTYTDPDTGLNEWAVYTTVPPADPQPPTPLPAQPNVFMAGRSIGVPALDFTGITQDLATIKSEAQTTGYYAPSSTAPGYDLVLSSTTFTVYKVTSVVSPSKNCKNSSYQDTGWGSWSVGSETLYATGTIPNNGVMFFEDNLWVRGTISGVRVTIASGLFPDNATTRTSITVNSNLLYSHYDGTDAIGLIAQNNINIGMVSANTLEVDAALIAQNGRVGRYYYGSGCSPYDVRSTITADGMIATNQRYGFAYTDGTGYQTRNLIYDANLLYAPPPSFPLTTDQYSLISWQEVQ